MGPRMGELGSMNLGVAAHIKAASAGFARYDPLQTPEERKAFENGIWLCEDHAHQIDHDERYFTVELLHEWKLKAEQRAFDQLTGAGGAARIEGPTPELIEELRDIVALLSLPTGAKLADVRTKVVEATFRHLGGFRRHPNWPTHAVALSLATSGAKEEASTYGVSQLAQALRAAQRVGIVAPPGTGKSTTMLQLAESLLSEPDGPVPIFVPLREWAETSGDLFAWIANRNPFTGIRADHLKFLSHLGQLALLLDGWNEVPQAARLKLILELEGLARDFPLLCVAMSTRRQAADVPLEGRRVVVLPLSLSQQREIARGVGGDGGLNVLDSARQTGGLRDLVSVPLYLSVLLKVSPTGHLPETKEQVLRLFVERHEADHARRELLDRELQGNHKVYLTALAVEAHIASNTAISTTSALVSVGKVNQNLQASHLVQSPPNPRNVLEVLVNSHALERDAGDSYSFQHQQFQEWYASLDVEARLLASGADALSLSDNITTEILNDRGWEEAVLFATERMSRSSAEGISAVAKAVRICLQLDPMLAAAIIRRAPTSVWDQVSEEIQQFAKAWHRANMPDRAVGFMIATGRPEFSDIVWPLVATHDTQLVTLRLGGSFDPAVLGTHLSSEFSALDDQLRAHMLGEFIDNGGVEGLDAAMTLVQSEENVSVRQEVFTSLTFHRADRQAEDVLRASSEEVWRDIAARGYFVSVSDTEMLDRLKQYEREYLEDPDVRPEVRLGRLLREQSGTTEGKVEQLLTLPSLDFRSDSSGGFYEAARLFPDAVGRAMKTRIELGLELPWRPDEYLDRVSPTDDGPVSDILSAQDLASEKAKNAARIAGPKLVKHLCNRYLAASANFANGGLRTEVAHAPVRTLEDVIVNTRASVFFSVASTYTSRTSEANIGRLSSLIVRHGRDGNGSTIELPQMVRADAVGALNKWAEKLLRSRSATRHQLNEVASAMHRVPDPTQAGLLDRMLDMDLRKYRAARAAYARDRSNEAAKQEGTMSYTWTYRDALARIGTPEVATILASLLLDDLFGADAAIALLMMSSKAAGSVDDKPAFRQWPDFEMALANRAARSADPAATTEYAESIFEAVRTLLDKGDATLLHQAASMASTAVLMPHGEKSELLRRLLESPLHPRPRKELVTKMLVGGEELKAEDIRAGLDQLIEASKTESWLLGDDLGSVVAWLELFAFSDNPHALIEALDMLPRAMPERVARAQRRLRDLLRGIKAMPGGDAIPLLKDLVDRDPTLVDAHELYSAIARRIGDPGAFDFLLDLAAKAKRGMDVAGYNYPEQIFHLLGDVDLASRFKASSSGPAKEFIGELLLVSNTFESFLLLSEDATGRRVLARRLNIALRDLLNDKTNASEDGSRYQLTPRDASALRQGLFEQTTHTDVQVAKFAARCLEAIDLARDADGYVEAELRHPAIEIGRPWPNVQLLGEVG